MAKRIRRTLTPQFKADVVLAILNGSQSMAELCRQHGLKRLADQSQAGSAGDASSWPDSEAAPPSATDHAIGA